MTIPCEVRSNSALMFDQLPSDWLRLPENPRRFFWKDETYEEVSEIDFPNYEIAPFELVRFAIAETGSGMAVMHCRVLPFDKFTP